MQLFIVHKTSDVNAVEQRFLQTHVLIFLEHKWHVNTDVIQVEKQVRKLTRAVIRKPISSGDKTCVTAKRLL